MAVDWGHRFKSFAYRCIAGAVKEEYESQIEKWAQHTKRVVAWAKLANKTHEDLVKAIHAQQQRNAETMLFMISLLAGPSMSWIAGAIEHKLGPRIFGAIHSSNRRIPNPKYQPPAPLKNPNLPTGGITILPGQPPKPPKPQLPKPFPNQRPAPKPMPKPTEPEYLYVEVFDPHHSQTLSKVLGDFGGSMSQMTVNGVAKTAASPNLTELQSSIDRVAGAVSLDMFEVGLENAWREAKRLGGIGIMNYAGSISSDPSWGEEFMRKNSIRPQDHSQNVWPHLEQHGYGLILKMVDKQRVEWARNPKWFLFGNDPPPIVPQYAINTIETEIWALWINSENLSLSHTTIPDQLGLGHDVTISEAKGKSGIGMNRIFSRLLDLGIIEGGTFYETSRRSNAKYDPNSGLQAMEVNDIYGNVDTDEELASMKNWAKKRQPQMLGGKLGFTPRSILALDPANIQS